MISPFEYVTVLISIILGMGITQIVSGFTKFIHRWDDVKLYWPHMILIGLVFIIHIQEWWFLFELRSMKFWRLPTFLFIILYPVNLYILARILFPLRWGSGVLDLKQFYYDNFRRIYFFTITLDVLAILNNVFISGYSVLDQAVQFLVLIIVSLVAALNRKDEWIHASIAIMLLIISFLIILVTWDNFLIVNG